MILKTAVLVFVYKRPDHTKLVIEGLRKNDVKELYVFADGAKSSEDVDGVALTRKEIDNIDWCIVNKIYRNDNIGLANSVINGITQIFDLGYERVIIIEDDCVVREGFIEFMENAFDFYEDVDSVMHISGFGFPIKKVSDEVGYFTPFPCSWGWGTWKKYWENCDFYQFDEYRKLLDDEREVEKFNYSGEGFSAFLQMLLDRKVNSWQIRWYYHIYTNNGRCLWKYDSLVKNVGFDGTGEHKVKYDRFNQMKNRVDNKTTFPSSIEYNDDIIKSFRRFYRGKSKLEFIKSVLYTAKIKILRY